MYLTNYMGTASGSKLQKKSRKIEIIEDSSQQDSLQLGK